MKIETLNIQGGWKIEEIGDEIVHKLFPFDILVLQEVKISQGIDCTEAILSKLNGFSAIKWHPQVFDNEKYGKMGNAIIYNDKLNLVSNRFIKVPDYKPRTIWRLLRLYFGPVQRLAISSTFEINGSKIGVTNVHLEYSGDASVRHKQIKYLLGKLNTKDVDVEIVLGDFNTLAFIDKKLPELDALKAEGFKLVSNNIKYTADADSPDPNWFATPYIQFLRKMGFDLRQNLDHVLIKGDYKSAKCKKVKINSSDHDAVVCEVDF